MSRKSEKTLQEKLKDFECQRCNMCCRQPGYVYLEDGEADRMAKHLGLEIYEFTEKYCDVVDRKDLVLKQLKDHACVLLGATGCRVHAVKPEQCKEFPFKWRSPKSFDYCEGLKKIFPKQFYKKRKKASR